MTAPLRPHETAPLTAERVAAAHAALHALGISACDLVAVEQITDLLDDPTLEEVVEIANSAAYAEAVEDEVSMSPIWGDV